MITHKICDHSDEQNHPNDLSDKVLIEAIKALVIAYANLTLRMKDFYAITCYNSEKAYKSDVELLIKNNFVEKLDLYEKLRKMASIGTTYAIYETLDDAFDDVKDIVVIDPNTPTGGI